MRPDWVPSKRSETPVLSLLLLRDFDFRLFHLILIYFCGVSQLLMDHQNFSLLFSIVFLVILEQSQA